MHFADINDFSPNRRSLAADYSCNDIYATRAQEHGEGAKEQSADKVTRECSQHEALNKEDMNELHSDRLHMNMGNSRCF